MSVMSAMGVMRIISAVTEIKPFSNNFGHDASMTPTTLMELMEGNLFAHFVQNPSLLFWESVLGRWKQFALPENNFSNTPTHKTVQKGHPP